MKLWHDDIRQPPTEDWVWCRTNMELIGMLAGMSAAGDDLTELSLDHDMGLDQLDPSDPQNALMAGSSRHDGTELVRELSENESLLNYLQEQQPRVIIHSWNTYAAIRMHSILKNRCGLRRVTVRPFSS